MLLWFWSVYHNDRVGWHQRLSDQKKLFFLICVLSPTVNLCKTHMQIVPCASFVDTQHRLLDIKQVKGSPGFLEDYLGCVLHVMTLLVQFWQVCFPFPFLVTFYC